MVARRTGIMLAFLMLLSPATAVPVAQVIGLKNMSEQVTASESTVAYTNIQMHTYYGSGSGTTLVQTAASFPERVIGFMAPQGKCALYSLPVTVTSGTSLSVRMTANAPVNLFILSAYPSGDLTGCKVSGTPLLSEANFTDFTLNWTAPEAGLFYFVFTGPTAVILLADHGSMQGVQQAATVTYPTSTQTNLSTYSEIITMSSTLTVTSPLYLQATTQNWMLIIGSVVLSIAITLFLLAFVRRLH